MERRVDRERRILAEANCAPMAIRYRAVPDITLPMQAIQLSGLLCHVTNQGAREFLKVLRESGEITIPNVGRYQAERLRRNAAERGIELEINEARPNK